jgi:hypothetical protein
MVQIISRQKGISQKDMKKSNAVNIIRLVEVALVLVLALLVVEV